jgi:hypothetical protein
MTAFCDISRKHLIRWGAHEGKDLKSPLCLLVGRPGPALDDLNETIGVDSGPSGTGEAAWASAMFRVTNRVAPGSGGLQPPHDRAAPRARARSIRRSGISHIRATAT